MGSRSLMPRALVGRSGHRHGQARGVRSSAGEGPVRSAGRSAATRRHVDGSTQRPSDDDSDREDEGRVAENGAQDQGEQHKISSARAGRSSSAIGRRTSETDSPICDGGVS